VEALIGSGSGQAFSGGPCSPKGELLRRQSDVRSLLNYEGLLMLKMVIMQVVPPGLALMALGWVLTRMGVVPALVLWVTVWGCLCGAAALLLQTTEVGEMSWKNYVAGVPLRWGHFMSGGQLWRLALGAWLIWSLLGVAVALAWGRGFGSVPAEVSAAPSPNGLWPALLLVSWFLLGAASLYLLSVLLKNFTVTSNSGRSLLTILLVLLSLAGTSIWLKWTGQVRAAALVAGGPIVLVGAGYGLFMLVILACGRNARWN
jgi:fucose 4-O-acetylase-like acetyltransferase